ncbi:uncharacterized protein LOC143147874 isoform X2 [Ptiloglossa arizonensis]
MKGVIAMILLLTVVEGNVYWRNFHDKQWRGPPQPPGHSFQPPGHSFQPPGHSFQPPGHSFQPPGHSFPFPGFLIGSHNQYKENSAIDLSNAEWICRNPKTSDMMIIATIDGTQTMTIGQPSLTEWWLNQHGTPNQGENPASENSNNENSGPGTRPPLINTPTPQPNIDKATHGGDGLIDIRMNYQ